MNLAPGTRLDAYKILQAGRLGRALPDFGAGQGMAGPARCDADYFESTTFPFTERPSDTSR
jgi:hypothetical protein